MSEKIDAMNVDELLADVYRAREELLSTSRVEDEVSFHSSDLKTLDTGEFANIWNRLTDPQLAQRGFRLCEADTRIWTTRQNNRQVTRVSIWLPSRVRSVMSRTQSGLRQQHKTLVVSSVVESAVDEFVDSEQLMVLLHEVYPLGDTWTVIARLSEDLADRCRMRIDDYQLINPNVRFSLTAFVSVATMMYLTGRV